jgi:hypothetical protein
MTFRTLTTFFFVVLCGLSTLALPYNHTDSLVNAAIDNGAFQNPAVFVRPRFRYWVPDASVDLPTLANDVAGARQAGAGGVDVLG